MTLKLYYEPKEKSALTIIVSASFRCNHHEVFTSSLGIQRGMRTGTN